MGVLQTDKSPSPPGKQPVIEYLSSIFLRLYIITMPFISAFSFTGTISMPLIFAVFLFSIMTLQIFLAGGLPEGFVKLDIIIIFFLLVLALLSYLINGLGNSKSLNHTIAYASSFLLFYVTVKFFFFQAKNKADLLNTVLLYVSYATIISAIYTNIEFISANIFDVNLNEYIPRPSEAEMFYEAGVNEIFYRARGFANESGVFTQMMELFAPLTIYYFYFSGACKWPGWLKTTFVTFIVFSIIFAASSATFVVVPVATALAMLIYFNKVIHYFKKKDLKFYLRALVVAFVVFIINSFLSIYASIALSISDKMDSGSFDDRKERIDFFNFQFSHFNLVNKSIGAGPAGFEILGFDDSKSIISLYYGVTFELGIIGLFLLLSFIVYSIFKTITIPNKIGFFLIISMLAGSMHYYFIHNFWVPWFWFIGALAMFCNFFYSAEKAK